MRIQLQPLLLAALALSSCHSTIEVPDDMTVERARAIIESYTRGRAPFNGVTYIPDAEGNAASAQVMYKGQRVNWFPLTAGDTFFQRGERTGQYIVSSVKRDNLTISYRYPLMRVIDTYYAEIGEFYTGYSSLNVVTPFTAFVIGPTMIQPYHGPDPDNPMIKPANMFWMTREWTSKNTLMSFIPLWLVGLPFWVKTDEEELAEALLFMKARQSQR